MKQDQGGGGDGADAPGVESDAFESSQKQGSVTPALTHPSLNAAQPLIPGPAIFPPTDSGDVCSRPHGGHFSRVADRGNRRESMGHPQVLIRLVPALPRAFSSPASLQQSQICHTRAAIRQHGSTRTGTGNGSDLHR